MDKISSLDLIKAGKEDGIILICKNDCVSLRLHTDYDGTH